MKKFAKPCILSVGMPSAALVASSMNKPIIGFLSKTSELGNKTKYTTLARLADTMSYMGNAIAAVLKYHKWSSIAIVRTNKGACDIALSGIDKYFLGGGITVSSDLSVDITSSDNVANALMILKMTARSKVY